MSGNKKQIHREILNPTPRTAEEIEAADAAEAARPSGYFEGGWPAQQVRERSSSHNQPARRPRQPPRQPTRQPARQPSSTSSHSTTPPTTSRILFSDDEPQQFTQNTTKTVHISQLPDKELSCFSENMVGVHYILGKKGVLILTLADAVSALSVTFPDGCDYNHSLDHYLRNSRIKIGFHLERLACWLSTTGYALDNFLEINDLDSTEDSLIMSDESLVCSMRRLKIPNRNLLKTDNFWMELREFRQVSALHCNCSANLATMCFRVGQAMSNSTRQQELMGWSFLGQNFGEGLKKLWVEMASDGHYNTILGTESEFEVRVESATLLNEDEKPEILISQVERSSAIHQAGTKGSLVSDSGKRVHFNTSQVEGKTARLVPEAMPELNEQSRIVAQNTNPHCSPIAAALSKMLQAGMKKFVKAKMQRFLNEPAIRAIFCAAFIPSTPHTISLDGLQHITSDRAPDVMLSTGQQEALDLINSAAQCCTVVQGPPGTGKTFLAATAISLRNIEAMGHTAAGRDVTLFVTETNAAALNIAVALEKKEELAKDKRFKLVLTTTVEDFAHGDEKRAIKRLREKGLIWVPSDTTKAQNRNLLKGTRILVCTFGGLVVKNLRDLLVGSQMRVKEMFVDEGGKVPSCVLVPILYFFNQVQKLVILGDPAQLPPYGPSSPVPLKSSFSYYEPHPSFLELQRRVPGPIAEILSAISYNDLLQSTPEKAAMPVSECVFWIDVAGTQEKDGSSVKNEAEAAAVLKALASSITFQNSFNTPGAIPSVFVITLYRGQKVQIKTILDTSPYKMVSVGTVDSIQGQERDVVVFSLVRTATVGFADQRRINVALSRGKKELWMIGDRAFWLREHKGAEAITRIAKIATVIRP